MCRRESIYQSERNEFLNSLLIISTLLLLFLQNPISDIFNGFPIELSIASRVFTASSDDGNPNPTNLASYPIVVISGQSMIQVETFKDCDGQECIPDLALNFENVTYE